MTRPARDPDDEPVPIETVDLTSWVDGLRAGKPNAAAETFKKVVATVEVFAGVSFGRFPRVGRFVELDDVVQGSLVRLLAAMRDIRPESRRHFYGLVNAQIRRELLDLARRYYGPAGPGANLVAAPVGEGPGEVAPPAVGPAADLDRLTALHEAVERLPAEEREAFGLTYYHGWGQRQIAGLFGVSVRTVQRWLEAATGTLRREVGAG